jgi:mRNA interferase HigB
LVIISKTIIREYGVRHADANDALNSWYDTVLAQDWSNLNEMKQTFNSLDYVGNERYVFNIKGNRYRIVAMIFFDIRTVFIRFIGTHAEYDKIDATTI